MQNLIDLAAERVRRQELARQASEGAEQFAAELHRAGESLANLAWALAAPIRHHDQDLTLGIYRLALVRLSKIVSGALADINHSSDIKYEIAESAKNVSFSYFQKRLLILMATNLD